MIAVIMNIFHQILLRNLYFKSLKDMARMIILFQIVLLSCLCNNSFSANGLSLVTGKIANVTNVIGGSSKDLKGPIVKSEFITSLKQSDSSCNQNVLEDRTSLSDTMSLRSSDRKIHFRLSKSVVPEKYHIHLNPNLDTGLFEGIVSINIEVREPTDIISLHSKKLNISTSSFVRLTDKEVVPISIKNVETDDHNEVCMIYLSNDITPGSYKLTLHYNGNMRNKIIGLYESVYKNTIGKESKIATSKFEPTYARQAFPCFDEPAMKATFTVELVTPKDYIALSNMDQLSSVLLDDGTSIVKFNKSVKMSTYLVCFIICNFKFEKDTINANKVGDDFEMRVYAAPDQIKKVDFSLMVGKNVTEYYIDYFQLPYPLPKLDMIAIPDFVSGAMEHWGLVTFKETNLLYDSTTTSTANMQNIARVVAHEVSHMWFGNLVTMKWWDELWLNEGFASYMQYKALDKLYPDWKMLDQFVTSNSHSIYALDGTLSSHPIVQTVNSPDEITTIFDGITYNKGAAVIRMLEGFVTPETFQKGVRAYMKKHQFGNTVTQDLLKEIADIYEVANPTSNLVKIMDSWTRQTGLPLVTVEVVGKTAVLTQKRFLVNSSAELPSEGNYRWHIPITYTTTTEKVDKVLWLTDEPENKLTITLKDDDKYIKVNNDQVGYYRVNYSPEMWESLNKEISAENSKLTVSDKTHLLNDAFSLAEASVLDFKVALDLTKYLKNEENYTPWVVASSEMSALKRIMSESVGFIDFKIYVRKLTKGIYEKLTWTATDKDAHDRRLLRSVILNMACSFGNEDCMEEASNQFRDYLNKTTIIDPDLKNTIYYYGIEATGEKEWLQLWDKFLAEKDAQEKSKLMQALAASTNPALLKRYLLLAWDNDLIRSQDHLTIVQYISSNPVGTSLVWDHVRENWLRFVEKFSINSRVLGTTVSAITRSFSSELKLSEMETFFAKYPDAGAGAVPREQAKENVKNNIQWLKNHDADVTKWLAAEIKPDQ